MRLPLKLGSWRRPSKAAGFWMLMGVSALSAFLLPRQWTSPGRGLFQPLVVLQWPASWFAARTSEAIEHAAERPLPADQARELRREVDLLRQQVLNQRLALQQAAERVHELSGLADQMPDSHAGIIIAPVVAYDTDPRRSTLLIAKTSMRQTRWVRVGQWVVAGGAGAAGWDREATIRDLLWRGWLIGRVSEVQPQVARVQLTTDPSFAAEVRAARLGADGSIGLAGDAGYLQGQGKGQMRITQAVEDYFRTGYRIVVVPASRDLPVPMTIGRIESSTPRDDSAQHYNLTVLPWGRIEDLTHVYVLVTEP